ncbi:acetyl-CoA carboxylase biotin carboxylase subunit family protein [Kitasatospora sp. NPDC059811]|uniref:ATP-grasp domain-containing protein n=1 Tax=Streptomycetaceae TaxID=2062 RepID=UPI0007AFD546|nr:ATP-grasp domain-containing protein [Streptomyces sp. MJM8645]
MTHLLVISVGTEVYRRYILEDLRAAGIRVTAVQAAPQRPWAAPLVDVTYEVDLRDRTQVVGLTEKLHAAEPFDGVLTYDEAHVELAAEVAHALGLPGLSREAAARSRDKRLMREAFRVAGVPSAQSVLAMTADRAAEAAELIGYPVVLKPRNLGGSYGVVRVDDEERLRELFQVAVGARIDRIDTVPGVLVEEYLEGPELSVESVVQDGQVHICGLTEKEVGFAPYFEELGHVCRKPSTYPGYAEIERVVVAAHHALGITYGATHSELRITARGPRMIETAARLGGEKIPYATRLATGVDQVALTVAALTGGRVEVRPERELFAGVRMVYPSHDGRVRTLGHRAGAEELWHELVWHATPGQDMALPPRGFMTRLGHIVVVESSNEALTARLRDSVAALTIELDPLPAQSA